MKRPKIVDGIGRLSIDRQFDGRADYLFVDDALSGAPHETGPLQTQHVAGIASLAALGLNPLAALELNPLAALELNNRGLWLSPRDATL